MLNCNQFILDTMKETKCALDMFDEVLTRSCGQKKVYKILVWIKKSQIKTYHAKEEEECRDEKAPKRQIEHRAHKAKNNRRRVFDNKGGWKYMEASIW